MITHSTVKTAFANAYLKRLCRHFAHKIPASVDGDSGEIEFPFGLCKIETDENEMRIRIEVGDPKDLDRAEKVLADHLIRMANRDDPIVEWVRQGA